jgi:hypothetical protein
MPKVMVYKCPHTGRLFEKKNEYDRHLRSLSRDRSYERKEAEKRAALAERWRQFRESITDVAQLPNAIIEHQDLFWYTASLNASFMGDFEVCRKTGIWPKLVEFTEFRLQYSDSVSNSHSCPVDGVTNWGGRVEGAPRGYPGWSGRADWISEWPHKLGGHYPSGQLLKGSRIHTGTGGGGGSIMRKNTECQSHGYHIELFLTDWEGLAKTKFVEKLKARK